MIFRMEKKLTQKELLRNLLKRADDPFTTSEQKYDIQHVLETSSNFQGMNHLFLAQCYFEDHPLFLISEGKALTQAYLGLKEGNPISYYYLYRLEKYRDRQKARNFLRMAVDYNVPKACLEMGRCLWRGDLFPKDEEEAFRCYQKAADLGEKEGYYYMLLLAASKHDIALERSVYEIAKKRQVHLPGVIE